jgi:hypothetical protein
MIENFVYSKVIKAGNESWNLRYSNSKIVQSKFLFHVVFWSLFFILFFLGGRGFYECEYTLILKGFMTVINCFLIQSNFVL